MNLGTHMPDGERRKPIDIEVCRSHCPSTCLQLGFRPLGALLIFLIYVIYTYVVIINNISINLFIIEEVKEELPEECDDTKENEQP